MDFLEEQDRQECEFQNSPEAIAKSYIVATKCSIMPGYDMAVSDQLYASDKSPVPPRKFEEKAIVKGSSQSLAYSQ